ncbi:zinc finger, C3HC4 type, partial [Necator americanus]
MRGVRGAALIHTVVRPWLCGVVPACIGRYCSGHCPLLKHQVQVPYVTSCLYVLVILAMGFPTRVMSASPNLKCGLCHDYLVNAVTVAGCMHSFCEECLLKNLSISGICPTKGCKKNVDKNGYHRDSTLQMLVYKFMPRIFFENAEKDVGNADLGEKKVQRELIQASTEICDPEELLSICLEFVPAPPAIVKSEDDSVHPSTSTSQNEPPAKKAKKSREQQREVQQSFRRFFRCAAKVPIRTIRRLLETKLFLTDQFGVHFISDRDFQDISDDVTLRTLVLDGGFDRTRPFRLFFTLVPTVIDDAPPVLDAETMPCLMPEAPVHQETPPAMQPPGQIQPVQIVSPVVPALTVSLSTDIYGHSAPIITQQCAPRKRRKLSDPKRSPTEKSPTTSAPHPTPIAPNMLVGQLLRPMFIAQQPFLHRSPPNMHISMPFSQTPQAPNAMECAPLRKPGTSYENENGDRPPRLQREDATCNTLQLPLKPPAPCNSTPQQNSHYSSLPSTTEMSKLPRLDLTQHMSPFPVSTPTVASVLKEQKATNKAKSAQDGNSVSSTKSTRTNNAPKNTQLSQKPDGEPRTIPNSDLPMSSSLKDISQKNKESPKHESVGASPSRKTSKPSTVENGTCNNSPSKSKPTTKTPPSDTLRPAQPTLPQPVSADVRTTQTSSETPSSLSLTASPSTATHPPKPTSSSESSASKV